MKIHDTHTHIYLDQFKKDRDEVMQRAIEAGVVRCIMPNIDHTTVDDMLAVEEKFKGHCFAAIGLHPCSVKKDFEKELYRVEDWLAKRGFVGIGETGIDLYWDNTFFNQQKEALVIQIELAKRYNIPIILHTRDAITETIDIIEREQDGKLKGVFHCFTGDENEAKEIVELNFFLGIGGVATFKNSGLDKVLASIALDHIILETDSPYLAPVPYRGKRNEPSYTKLVLEKIAQIKQMRKDEIAKITTSNSEQLFKT